MTEKERMLAGELYLASDPELVRERLECRERLHAFNSSRPQELEERRALLAELLPHAGPKLHVEPPFYCDYGYNIRTGKNVYFNFDCVALDVCPITIGDDVMFATKVQLLTATHPVDWEERARGPEGGKPIRIGSHVWVGAGALILPGVTIGDRAVIGAGSVVTKDVPDDCLVAGNPARMIRRLGKANFTQGLQGMPG